MKMILQNIFSSNAFDLYTKMLLSKDAITKQTEMPQLQQANSKAHTESYGGQMHKLRISACKFDEFLLRI